MSKLTDELEALVKRYSWNKHQPFFDDGQAHAFTRALQLVREHEAEQERIATGLVAELRALGVDAFSRPGVYQVGRERAFGQAADVAESILGLKRCGVGCNGKCELTEYGPTRVDVAMSATGAKP